MKNGILLLVVTLLTSITFAEDRTCTNPSMLQNAKKAKEYFDSKLYVSETSSYRLNSILKVTVETCSEVESYAASSEDWVCGVFVWFSGHRDREQFHQTTLLWNGLLNFPAGEAVPVCSKFSPIPP